MFEVLCLGIEQLTKPACCSIANNDVQLADFPINVGDHFVDIILLANVGFNYPGASSNCLDGTSCLECSSTACYVIQDDVGARLC